MVNWFLGLPDLDSPSIICLAYIMHCCKVLCHIISYASCTRIQYPPKLLMCAVCVCVVIFDAGLGSSSDSWWLVYQEISKFTKVIISVQESRAVAGKLHDSVVNFNVYSLALDIS